MLISDRRRDDTKKDFFFLGGVRGRERGIKGEGERENKKEEGYEDEVQEEEQQLRVCVCV